MSKSISVNSRKKPTSRLGTKLSFIIAFSFIFTIATMLTICMNTMNSMMLEVFEEECVTGVASLERELQNLQFQMDSTAARLAEDPDFGSRIADGTTASLSNLLEDSVVGAGASFALLTDNTGRVLFSTTDEVSGSLQGASSVTQALKQHSSGTVEALGNVPYAVVSASPIYNMGNLVGTVVMGADLRNPTLVDGLKEVNAYEYTIFGGNTRINTTIVQDGQRAIGTTLSEEIAATVIDGAQRYIGEASILGEKHICAYLPIVNASGEVSGVLFAGRNSAILENRLFNSVAMMGGAGLGLMVLTLGILSVFILSRLTRPMKILANTANSIAEGDLNISIDDHFKDELGVLSDSLKLTVERLADYGKYIHEITNVLEQIADGNLDFKLTHAYLGEFSTIKQALERISASLNETMTKINHSADYVATSSNQLSEDSQQLAMGASDQASAIQQLSASIAELSEQVKSNADSAQAVGNTVSSVGDGINASNTKMHDMISAMNDISKKSFEIGKIIKTIDDIAFQTNILALNASVEAARAGAAGKGFAVVADEVRNLAAKSAEAAKDTTELIESSLAAVRNGTNIADQTADSLSQVVAEVATAVDAVHGIGISSAAQALAIGQITQGVEQISGVVQQNTATAQESAAAAETLLHQAVALNKLVSRFSLSEE